MQVRFLSLERQFKMSNEQKMSPEEYRKILEGIELLDIALVEAKVMVNKDQTQPGELQINIKDSKEYKLQENKVIDIHQRYELDARKPKSKSRFLQVSATFLVRLRSKEEFTADFYDIYKEVSLPLNTWPFFREYLHSNTARMGIPPLTLPLLKR